MAHSKLMKLTRIESDLLNEIRSLPLPDNIDSDIKRVDYLIRLGMKYVGQG